MKLRLLAAALAAITLTAGAASAQDTTSEKGKLSYALRFVMRNPDLRLSVVAVSASAVASQFFIMATIRAYGALLFAATMTTRQIFSVILSCVYFRRPLTQGQILGVVIVFGALYAKSLWRQGGAPKAH